MTKIATTGAVPLLQELKMDSLTASVLSAPAPAGGTSRNDEYKSQEWQSQAWEMYDQVGELRYLIQWEANAASRCALVASDIAADGQPTGNTEDLKALEVAKLIAGGPGGRAALLSRLVPFLSLPGDGWVAIIARQGKTEWHVLSPEEVNRDAYGKVKLTLADGTEHVVMPTDTLTRVHRPHARNSRECDSPVRAALPILREIVRLTAYIDAIAKSRLTGAGLLIVPDELTLPEADAPTAEPLGSPQGPSLPPLSSPVDAYDEIDEGRDRAATPTDVQKALVDVASTAIKNPSSAAATVPITIGAPGDLVDKIKHIKFGSDFTDTVIKLRDQAIKRLALALDVPPEILLGTGQANHWSGWQIEESAIKIHVEPLLTLICQRLTVSIFRPMLAKLGHPDPESMCLWFDPTGLTMKPNRLQPAMRMYELGLIKGETVIREAGFDKTDMPDDKELEERAKRNAVVATRYGGSSDLPTGDTHEAPDTQPDDTGASPAQQGDLV